jgi:hypothetical protein
MKRVVFYAGGRPFESLREAAAEVSRISGEDTEIWRLRKILDRNKGFMNGIPVSQKVIEQTDEASADEDEEPEEPRKTKRYPLMKPPVRGLPPRWV